MDNFSGGWFTHSEEKIQTIFGIFYSSIGRRAAIMRWRYADATPAFVRTYDAFAALKPALV